MNPMKMLLSRWLGALALGGWAASLAAQQMPQDNWRYNQHQFSAPDPTVTLSSIAIGKGGVYVGFFGTLTNSIGQFQENGVFIRQFGTFGGIRGIACDSAGNVYVLDAGDSTVKAFDKDGNYLRQWGGAGTNDGQFRLTVDFAKTAITVDTNDQIYVCDPGNTLVQVFDGQGNFLRKWGTPGGAPSQFRPGSPVGIAASPYGRFYVNTIDERNFPTTASVFDGSGNFVRLVNIDGYYVTETLCISPDGLLLLVTASKGDWTGRLGIYDTDDRSLGIAYYALGSVGGNYHGPTCVALNKRGDMYSILQNKVEIMEREYSSVQNPPTPPALPLPIVLSVSQRTNTAWLDVDYQVTHAEASNVMAAALAFINGSNTLSTAVLMSTFVENTATNLGPNVRSNTKLRFTWNMGADWSIDFAQIQVEVLAKDSRNLMGFHWITVPADGTNPALQISSAPVPESELLSVWYWLIATHSLGMSFANGTVTGLGGAYTGQLLANDSGTTSLGRAFAYERMNVRAITAEEITRANAGRYGFTSVDANSVVKLP